ncbi:MAG: cobalt ECF transporter T component CbiQ [Dorea sp.]|nr:cobalt ECF transporter T component CbiQ [Dorea sp.]
MSKLDHALYEIHHMDTLADKDQWLNRIHPLVKLIVTVSYIAVTVSFHKYSLAGLLRMGVYPAALFILGDLSFTDTLKRLRIVLPLVCFIGLFNPFFDRQPVTILGMFTVTAGMISMVTLMLKGIFSVLAAYLLIASTSIEKICSALRMIHIPSILVTQILLTYRYISLLLEEAGRITDAYSLRAPKQKGVHFKVWGSLAGQLLLRSMDRAEAVYQSMTLRGYRGEFYHGGNTRISKKDTAYLLVWSCLFAALKLI